MPINHGKFSELPDHQYTMIGRVIVEFSNIDTLLGIMLSRLLLTPEYLGRTYSDQLPISRKVSAIEQALLVHIKRYRNKIVPEQTVGMIKEVLKKIDEIRVKRNKFAHSNFGRFVDDMMFVTKFSGKSPDDYGELSDTFVLTDIEIKNIYDNAYKIVEELGVINIVLKEVDETFILRAIANIDFKDSST